MINSVWPTKKLSEIAPSKPLKMKDIDGDDKVWQLNLNHIEANTGKLLELDIQPYSLAGNSTHWFDERYVLYSKLRPYLNKVLLPNQKGLGTTELVPMLPDERRLNRKYLAYYLKSKQFVDWVSVQTAGAKMPRVSMKVFWKHKIPLPPLPEQQKIATILDAADRLRQKDQQLIDHYTTLSQSLFLKMFGDPVTNPMGWEAIKLDEIADIASGVTKGRKLKIDELFEIPYMRVANVQAGFLNLNEVKTIPGTKADLIKFSLKKGDVLLTEGGDPDKLGRGTVWNEEIKNCIHQNHIFRVRLTCNKSTPVFLSWLCGSEYGKRYFLKSGKQTTGIASINKTQLKKFPVLRPPIELQNQFAQHIQKIEQQKQQAQASLEKSQALFNSLLQRAFKGELTQ